MSTRLPLSNRCHGFSLVEVLAAMAILTIAVLGVGVAVGIQSGGTAQSVSVGLGAVSRAGLLSTAAFLAQERLEQVKRLKYTLSNDPFGGGPCPTVLAGFPDEGFGAIAGYPNFSRQVRFCTDTPTPNIKSVTVTVFFNAPGDRGPHQERIAISTLMAARPPAPE